MREAREQRSAVHLQGGFTLIELMIVLTIIAIFAELVGPTFQDTIQRNRRLAAVEDRVAMLATARSEAVSRAAPVAVCASSNQSACNSTQWEDGFLIFVDNGAGGGTALDGNFNGGEQLLRSAPAEGAGVTIRSANFADAGGILYDTDGMIADRGTLVICDGMGDKFASAIVLNRSGQPRLATDEDGDDVVEDDTGNGVACS